MAELAKLLDIAGVVRFMELRRALAEAEYQRLVTLAEVESVPGRGRCGSAALRAALLRAPLPYPTCSKRARRGMVLRYTWRQLTDASDLVIADLRRHGVD